MYYIAVAVWFSSRPVFSRCPYAHARACAFYHMIYFAGGGEDQELARARLLNLSRTVTAAAGLRLPAAARAMLVP